MYKELDTFKLIKVEAEISPRDISLLYGDHSDDLSLLF